MANPDSTVVDLNDIKVVQQIGGTIDDTEMVNGMVFDKGASKGIFSHERPSAHSLVIW